MDSTPQNIPRPGATKPPAAGGYVVPQQQSHQYQELVKQIKKALPQLSSEECLHYLSCLRQSNDGKLSDSHSLHNPRHCRSQLHKPPRMKMSTSTGWRGRAYDLDGRSGQSWRVIAPPSSQERGSSVMSDCDEGSMEECCICLGPLTEETTMALPKCGHVFHGELYIFSIFLVARNILC